ncbi:hypothetical protein MRX96_002867 [Rhipicephalus microplus]
MPAGEKEMHAAMAPLYFSTLRAFAPKRHHAKCALTTPDVDPILSFLAGLIRLRARREREDLKGIASSCVKFSRVRSFPERSYLHCADAPHNLLNLLHASPQVPELCTFISLTPPPTSYSRVMAR